nr:chorismate-binding protein [Legionella pneumophila]
MNNQRTKSIQFSVQSEFLPLISRDNYRNSFNAIQQALRAGRSYQVNFTQPFQTKFTGDPWDMYQRVNKNNPVPYAAFIRTEEADILSFSPERFLLYDNGEMLTSPIKGTIHRSKDPVVDKKLKEQLLKCPKNKAENVMIGRFAKKRSRETCQGWQCKGNESLPHPELQCSTSFGFRHTSSMQRRYSSN